MSRVLLAELCRIRLFRTAARVLYRLTAKCAIALCRSLEDVKAAYLVGSMASGDIAPGLSDIDIVMVIEDLPADQEIRLVQLIERRLRFVLPPFGKPKTGTHVMIYASTEWKLFGHMLKGKRSGTPITAFEHPSVQPRKTVNHWTRSLHHLFKAFWRLQDLQSEWRLPSDNRLNTLLRLRLCERLVGALEDAWEEVGLSPQSNAGFVASVRIIRSVIGSNHFRRDYRGLVALLPNFLDAMDRSILNCLPKGLRQTGSLTWHEDQRVNECDNYSHSMALADDLRECWGDVVGDGSIHVSRIGSVDLVVCDSLSEECFRILTGWFAGNGEKKALFVSSLMLQVFYLNDAFGPSAFIRLKDRSPFIATGRLTPERFLMEAYAMFPRVRALERLSDPVTIQTYTQRFERLIGYTKGVGPDVHTIVIPNTTTDAPLHPGDSRDELATVHSRLRCLSDRLTGAE